MLIHTTTPTNILQILQIASILCSVIFVFSWPIESNKTNASQLIKSNIATTRANRRIIDLAPLTLGEWRPKFPALVREARAPADYSSL
jgi:hypothetical protein